MILLFSSVSFSSFVVTVNYPFSFTSPFHVFFCLLFFPLSVFPFSFLHLFLFPFRLSLLPFRFPPLPIRFPPLALHFLPLPLRFPPLPLPFPPLPFFLSTSLLPSHPTYRPPPPPPPSAPPPACFVPPTQLAAQDIPRIPQGLREPVVQDECFVRHK